MFQIGTYRGRSFDQVAAHDRKYCAWVMRNNSNLPPNLQSFGEYLLEQHGGVMPVGKYKNHFFNEIVQSNPEYGEWATSLGYVGPCLRTFVDFCMNSAQKKIADEEDRTSRKKTTRKRRRTPDAGKCKICMDKPIDCVIIPCGHLACCLGCANIIDQMRQRCPICRQDIVMIQPVYTT